MGKAAERRQPGWAATVRVVLVRAKGRCECCGRSIEAGIALDPHHVFGRSNQIRRFYADMPELVAAICRECHTKVTDHPRCYEAGILRQRAAIMFARAHGINYFVTYLPNGFTPLQAVRDIIRTLEQKKAA